MSSPRGARAIGALRHGALVPIAGVILTPMVWMLVSSLKSREDYFSGLFLPSGTGPFGIGWDKLTLDNYRTLIEVGFARPLVNSTLYASMSSLLATVFCAAAGYALAMYRFRGRRTVTAVVFGALVVPPTLLIAPTYGLLHDLGLLDTVPGLVAPSIVPAFGVFLFRQAVVQSVPRELIEAARIDGCSEVRIFFVIVFPLLRPMTGAFMLITFMAMWNNFLSPQIVLQSAEKQPLSVAIMQLQGVYKTDYGVLMAATVVSVAPVSVLFLLLQREFIQGLSRGATKG